MDQDPEQTPPQRSSLKSILIILLLLGGVGMGVLVYQVLQDPGASSADNAGFDVTDVAVHTPTSGGAVADLSKDPSSLGMVEAGGVQYLDKGAQAKRSKDKSYSGSAIATIRRICRENERRVTKLALAYKRKYPVIAQYEKDWGKYPDLHKLHQDWMKDKDPIKFARGLARSKNFPKMMMKYAPAMPVRKFVMEVVSKAPQELMSAVGDFTASDKEVGGIMDKSLEAMGVPAHMLGLGDSSIQKKTGEKDMIESAEQSQSQLSGSSERN